MSGPAAPTDPVPPEVTRPETPGLGALLTLASVVVVIAALYVAQEILIPITIAALLSLVLAPLVTLLRRGHFGRVPSVLFAVVVALGLIGGLGGLIATQFGSVVAQAPKYESVLMHKLDEVRNLVSRETQEAAQHLGVHVEHAANSANPFNFQIPASELSPLMLAGRFLGPVLSPLLIIVFVLIFAVFILLQREDLRDRLIRVFGSGDLHRTTLAMDDAVGRLSRYFLAQLAVNTCFGVVIGVGLFLIGVPSPLLWGTLAMVLRFLPYIGSPIASVGPLLLSAAISPHWTMLIWTAVLYTVVETITGQIVEPLTYGHSTGLSPFAVVAAATFWTWLWGPIGLLLSTPLTLCLVVLGRHVKRLEFLDILLGDRPALSPTESFYQRLLAGDPDEALDQAETILKQVPLSAYYDEVVLKGLQLAAQDAARGVLSQRKLTQLNDTIQDLVLDLDRHDDEDREAAPPQQNTMLNTDSGPPVQDASPAEPAPAVAPAFSVDGAVLCVAGRGPLDEVPSQMLAQILAKRSVGARVVSYESVTRERIATLACDGVAMVCISYLEITGTPAHVRYLLARLRRRIPKVKLAVGFWNSEDPTLRNEQLRQTIGADIYATNLRSMVEACLAEAGVNVS